MQSDNPQNGCAPEADGNSLSPAEMARYSRHLVLPEIGIGGQNRLKESRVLLVGAGGLGSPAAIYLAAAGIGRIGLADFDQVEVHNLQRQILHRESDIGRSKVESGEETLGGINPHVQIRLHPEGVTPENAIALFSTYDIIVDGSDNFSTRYLTADAAHLSGRPLIYGSLFKFEGQVSLFDTPAGGPCYRCLFPEPPGRDAAPNCAEAGVLGALCGLVGSLQAMETIKKLLGLGRNLSGSLLVIDALDLQFRTLRIQPDPQCPLCSRHPAITSIDPGRYDPADEEEKGTVTLEEMDPAAVSSFLESRPEALIVDVREPYEVAICRLERSINIPMGQIPSSLDAIPDDRPLFVLCHHGFRSQRVAAFLRTQGYRQVINIHGGIDAWSRTVDPEVQRY